MVDNFSALIFFEPIDQDLLTFIEGLLLILVVNISKRTPHQVNQGERMQLEEVQRRAVLDDTFTDRCLEKLP